MSTFWTSRFAARVQALRSSDIRELLHLVDRPDMISFAGGLPAPEFFPFEQFRSACEKVLSEDGAQALQYGTTEGYLPLRQMIARHMVRYGIHAGPRNIQITSGSQQALDLIGRVFLDEGDVVLVEAPTYLGALQAWRAYGVQFVAVPMDEDGVRVDQLEQAVVRHSPKLLYLVPNFQNPTGITLSELRRQRIVEIAARHRLPIIEDDPYGQLRYDGEHLTPLHVLDAERSMGSADPETRRVLYLSTFSKLLAPGLRVGWIAGPESVIARLALAKQGADLHTGTFAQMLAHATCGAGFLDRHVRLLRDVYRDRRNAMLAALEHFMPEGVRWTRPEGGLFLWVTLPEGLDARLLLRQALEAKVAFVPGASFHADGGGSNALRLNFSYATPERIAVGIERLAHVVEDALSAAHAA